MQKLKTLFYLLLSTFSFTSHAALLDFDDVNHLGVTLGGDATWSSIGGGHIYLDEYNYDDSIIFSSATYLNQFEMNAMAWQGFARGNPGLIDIAALDDTNQTVWEIQVDLGSYTSWEDWLTVSVETGGITQLVFYAPGPAPNMNGFWPSIDNMVINEQPASAVPLPGAVWLFLSGLTGLFLTGWPSIKLA